MSRSERADTASDDVATIAAKTPRKTERDDLAEHTPGAVTDALTRSIERSAAPDAAARQRELRQDYLVEVRRALLIARAGAVMWPLCVVYDYLQSFVLHQGDFVALVTLRAICELGLLVAVYRLSRAEPPDEEAFDRLTRNVMMLFSATLSGMCVATTGFESIYVAGLLLVAVGNVFVPRPFWPSLKRVFVTVAPHPLILGLATLFSDRLAAQLHDPRVMAITAQFSVVALCIIPGVAAFSSFYAEVRTQLYESRNIGRYRLVRQLGRGGMSEIWAAYHSGLQREVALKLLESDLQVDETFRVRFEHEVKATGQLTHANTVRVFDCGATEGGLLYYAMELLEGESLARFVRRRGRIEIARAIHLVRQAAWALAEAHAKGIIHRDVKPENLFVTGGGGEPDFVKVIDFGIAVVQTDRTENEIAGSATTISPEVVRGEPASPASDVYALGAVLYFLLARGYPFGGRRGADALRAHLDEVPRPPSQRRGESLPQALEDLVMRSLAKSPLDRPADARAFAEALDALAELHPWKPRLDAPRVDYVLEDAKPSDRPPSTIVKDDQTYYLP